MFKAMLICFFALIIFTFNVSFSQNPPAVASDNNGDPKWDDISDWSFKDYRPYVEANYGVGLFRHTRFTDDNLFDNHGYAEAKLGYGRIVTYREYVLDMDERYLFGSYSNKDMNQFDSDTDPEKIQSEMIRFGVGNRLGYGYQIGFMSILPYQQSQFLFSRLNTERPDGLDSNDIDILNRYEDSYRYSISTEGGVKFRVFETLSLTAGYEAAVIYPRVVFWPWLGSAIIQSIIVGGISRFAEDIVDHSNFLGPLMYAILRNGAAYGVYLGTREKMNWPFNSETPLTHETFKIGVSFAF